MPQHSPIQSKALRLLAEGSVRPDVAAPPKLFHVEGDHGRYQVVVGAHVRMCSCRAQAQTKGHCSHIAAVIAWVHASEAEKALMLDALAERRARDAVQAEDAFARLLA